MLLYACQNQKEKLKKKRYTNVYCVIFVSKAWITEMASYVKSIDSNHLLEAGLEGFYGSSKQQINPNFQVGTDFIANNQINGIDFATVHSYPDQW